MKLTNKMELPEAFVKACSIERHNKPGSYSATTLLKSAKEIILTERHYDELESDVSDNVWQIFGTAVHAIFEKQNDSNFKEEFFETEVLNSKITGRVDSYDLDKEILYDFKTASVWKIKFNDFEEWKKQGLIYAWLMGKNGLKVKECRFIALLKDHSKTEAGRNADYPKSPVYVYKFNVTEKDLEEIEKFIFQKVKEIEFASGLADDEIPECSAEERWATKPKFAVMKNGRKSALKLFDKRQDAEIAMESLGGNYIEERKGENKKCSGYCVCREFCHFYK